MLLTAGCLTDKWILASEGQKHRISYPSAAHLIPYKNGTLADLWPLSLALVEPGHDVASGLQIDSGETSF